MGVGTVTKRVISKPLPGAASLKRIRKFSGARRNNIKHGIKHSVWGQNLSVPLGFSRCVERQPRTYRNNARIFEAHIEP